MATFDLDKMAKKIAEEAINEVIYEGKTLSEWIEIIKAHSVDAEPIVRCKDCTWYKHGYCMSFDDVRPNDFCSRGHVET